MKRMKGFLKLTAVLLAAVMALPASAVLAEETEVTVTMTPNEVDAEKSDILVEADGDVETVVVMDQSSTDGDQPIIELEKNTQLKEDSDGEQIPLSEDVASVTVNVDGDIDSDHVGINTHSYCMDIGVTAEDVRVQGKDEAAGVGLLSAADSRITVEVGQVTACAEDSDPLLTQYAKGILVEAHGDSSATVSTGDISSTINWKGESDPGLATNVGIDVTTSGNSSVRIDTGNIEVVSKNIEGMNLINTAVEVESWEESSVTITAGSVTSKSNDTASVNRAVSVDIWDSSTLTFAAEGDIVAENLNGVGVAISMPTAQQAKVQAEIYADGTISGGEAGITLDQSATDRTVITAWQIGSGEDGSMIALPGGGDITDSVKDSVNYIVKLGKGFSNSDVTTANGNTVTFDKTADIVVTHGRETDGEDYTYHTAVEDEKVSLSFDLSAYDPDQGDTLKVLYNADDNKSAMKQGSKASGSEYTLAGNVITLLMKRGGGMKLAASVNHAHKYEAVVTEPTCTAGGYTTHTCSRCGDSYTDSETKATGHTPGAAVKENEVEPEAGKAGSYDEVVYCTKCGAEISRKTVTLDPLPEPDPDPDPDPEPEPEPEPDPEPVKTVTALVTVKDESDKITISFFANGYFEAKMENGSREKGTFRLDNDRLVLACGGTSVTVGEDGTFTYTSQADPTLSYQFRLDQAAVDTLKKALK